MKSLCAVFFFFGYLKPILPFRFFLPFFFFLSFASSSLFIFFLQHIHVDINHIIVAKKNEPSIFTYNASIFSKSTFQLKQSQYKVSLQTTSFCIALFWSSMFRYALTVQQQPQKARLCSFKDKGTVKTLQKEACQKKYLIKLP